MKPTLPTVGDKYYPAKTDRFFAVEVVEVIRSSFGKVTCRSSYKDGLIPSFEFTETLSEFRRLEKATLENGARFEPANS